jgi:hypothetical protein
MASKRIRNPDGTIQWAPPKRKKGSPGPRAQFVADHPDEVALMRADWPRAYRHGMTPLEWIMRWREQYRRCYLCQEPLRLVEAYMDHDHRCPHPAGHSCRRCRRGLVHSQCNTAIGLLGEDPDRLRRIAWNLASVKLASRPA